TVTGPNGLSLTVDDTTPTPGQTVTFDFSYTVAAGDAVGSDAGFTMGSNINTNAPGTNLDELALVGTCGGDIVFCDYDPANAPFEFQSLVPPPTVGQTVTGTADFTVSATATPGDVIAAYGGFFTRSSDGTTTVATDSALSLTVTSATPPSADLGVGLTATASGLIFKRVNYDVAVTNNGPADASAVTITTQLPSAVTSITSSTCTYSSSTHRASCPISAIANGATAHATFRANFRLLTIGLPLHATATRTASSPTDPNPANDSAGAGCVAFTTLIIHC
uniref:DUF11 domain-containing protein n=1 Tax=Conexibacter woesei TaxID=191495 RepID=UPI000686A561